MSRDRENRSVQIFKDMMHGFRAFLQVPLGGFRGLFQCFAKPGQVQLSSFGVHDEALKIMMILNDEGCERLRLLCVKSRLLGYEIDKWGPARSVVFVVFVMSHTEIYFW